MLHTATVAFGGDVAKAFELAVVTLTPIGFRIEERTGSSLRLTGPGLFSSRQSPLLGASSIHIQAGANELALAAELAGLRPLSRFVMLFPAGLCLLLLVIAIVVGAIVAPDQLGVIIGLAVVPLVINVLLWLILGPLMIRTFKHRTHAALDTLLNNLAMTARRV